MMARPLPHGSADGGSLSLEYVLAAPLLVIVISLVWAFARVGQLDSQLDSATRDAVRLVTRLPDPGTAQTVAATAVTDELGHSTCVPGSLQVLVTAITPAGQDDPVPSPGDTVTVAASCAYELSDLSWLGLGGGRARSQFSSLVDRYRGLS